MEFKLYKTKVKTTFITAKSTTLSSFYILSNEHGSIWFNRVNGEIVCLPVSEDDNNDFDFISLVYGYIGKVQITQNSHTRLIFAKKVEKHCTINFQTTEHVIYKLKQILILPLNLLDENIEIDLNQDKQDDTSNNKRNRKTDKFEERILEEIYKIFEENDGSFYTSTTFDLTNSIERQYHSTYRMHDDLWKRCDNRFFWNWELINELKSETSKCHSSFITFFMQGFIQCENINVELEALRNSKVSVGESMTEFKTLKLYLISRRSRHKIGTRLRARGIDDNGNVANFIETEQLVEVFSHHLLSFVIIRGSIPVYWSQPGINYRPAPVIQRTSNENKIAFRKHFEQLNKYYGHEKRFVIINLVEESGKESILADAYLEQVKHYNENNILYVQFDFHEHCKGMQFENVSRLIDKINNIISEMLYCWVDSKGLICTQNTVIRVNCVDCLDRTNVIQMVIAKHVILNQLRKLGLIGPEKINLDHVMMRIFRLIWANNGDAISQQYAGTKALKGDFTRTGERKFAGIMKDSMSSANRFYLRFKSPDRQFAYNLLQNIETKEETNEAAGSSSFYASDPSLIKLSTEETVELELVKEENIRQLVADCRKAIIDTNEDCYGSWALINFTDFDSNQIDPDTVILLTEFGLYICNYDETTEEFVDYQKIPITDVEKIELGKHEPILFKSSRYEILRIYYKINNQSGYFHSFRSSSYRFFNNLVITMKSSDEETESLKGVGQTIQFTASFFKHEIQYEETKILKKRSKNPNNFIPLQERMTSIAAEEQQTSSAINKLNNVSKFVGNKILDFSRKMKQQLPQNMTESQINETCDISINETVESDISDKNNNNNNSCIENKAVIENTTAKTTENDNSVYLPTLNQKQFTSKQLRLNHINNFISNSNSIFIII